MGSWWSAPADLYVMHLNKRMWCCFFLLKMCLHLNSSSAKSSERVLKKLMVFVWPAVWPFLSCESASVLPQRQWQQVFLSHQLADALQPACCSRFSFSSSVILTLIFDCPVSSSLFRSQVLFVPFWSQANFCGIFSLFPFSLEQRKGSAHGTCSIGRNSRPGFYQRFQSTSSTFFL